MQANTACSSLFQHQSSGNRKPL